MKTKKEAKAEEPKITFVQKVIGSDTYLVMADSALQLEDEFTNLYFTTSSVSNVVLQPPYEPKMLTHLVAHNNVLAQCIETMEVNIDGTGYEFISVEEGKEGDMAEKEALEAFFDEPYPGKGFIQIRRKLRRDMESTGYGFLEALRNLAGDLVGIRNLESYSMRFVKLDDPVLVTKTIMRGGKEVELQMYERERRFMQRVGNTNLYYREFGTTRQLDKFTGEWETASNVIPPERRATELIYFDVNPDTRGPYSVPRWINQLPSVVGSRKAEEQNLEFFDAGGMPPAIIFVQGGTLAKDASDQLRAYLSGKNKNRNRAVVVEAQSSSGSLESAGNVQVRVERFGAERANDAMYANYDQTAEEHIRIGFRLPPMFLGRAQDYNFATAVVSYMVAEEQVFKPERVEFDERINKTILKALGIRTWELRSKPITLKTVEDKMKALQLIADKVDGRDLVKEVNSIAGTDLKFNESGPAPEPTPGGQTGAGGDPLPGMPTTPGLDSTPPIIQAKTDQEPKKSLNLVNVAHEYGVIKGLLVSKYELTEAEKLEVLKTVESLSGADLATFNELVSAYTLGGISKDLVTLTADCCHVHG
jgi:PBSX family phage portal protein